MKDNSTHHSTVVKRTRWRQLISGLALAFIVWPIQPSYSQDRSQSQIPVEAKTEFWRLFKSTEGRFSVEIPGTPQIDTQSVDTPAGKIFFTKFILQTASTYGVIYADYPTKIEGSATINRILNDGAKNAAASVNAELLSMTEITVDGYPGRLLLEQMRDGSTMSVKMVVVGQRLYQVAVTLPSPSRMAPEQKAIYESAANKFLDSFKITAVSQQSGEVDEWLAKESADSVHSIPRHEQDGLYDGNVINGRALSLVKPTYPPKARAANAQGTVEVKVLIDEKGNVFAAQAVSGNPLLHDVSVAAAKASKFAPWVVGGNPVKVTGIVQYNFVEAKP